MTTLRPGLGSLALAFCQAAMSSVGGGTVAWVHQTVVRKRAWLNDEQFAQALALCQIMPGPNMLNLAVYVGATLRGWPGALAALFGLTALPFVVVMALGLAYFAYGQVSALKGVMTGLGAAAAGTCLGTGVRLGMQIGREARALGLVLLVYVALGWMRVPLGWVAALVLLLSALLFGTQERSA